MEGIFFYAVILVIMGVLGWLRRMQENKAERDRMNEPRTPSQDLPPETRRQLYGEGHTVREATPARRQSQSAPPVIPTAKPRQPKQQVRRPAASTPARRAQQVQRQAPPRRPSQSTSQQRQQRRPSVPKAQQPAMQRMRSALEQMAESMHEQIEHMEGVPRQEKQPPPRRTPQKSPEQLAHEQQQRAEEARRQRERQQAEAAKAKRQRERRVAVAQQFQSDRMFSDPAALKKGIIISEVLGRPKGLDF